MFCPVALMRRFERNEFGKAPQKYFCDAVPEPGRPPRNFYATARRFRAFLPGGLRPTLGAERPQCGRGRPPRQARRQSHRAAVRQVPPRGNKIILLKQPVFGCADKTDLARAGKDSAKDARCIQLSKGPASADVRITPPTLRHAAGRSVRRLTASYGLRADHCSR